MIKVLFVCHGNICRSPMAEFMFKDLVKKEGLEDKFIIESRATSSEEIHDSFGNPIYPPARKELEKHNIFYDSLKEAIRISLNDLDYFDYILCMDNSNIRDIEYDFKVKNVNKVKLLLDYTAFSRSISDPWYTGDFSQTFDDINLGINCFLEYLKNNKLI